MITRTMTRTTALLEHLLTQQLSYRRFKNFCGDPGQESKMHHSGTLFSAFFWVRFFGRKSVSSILRGGKPQKGPKKIACGANPPPSGGGALCSTRLNVA